MEPSIVSKGGLSTLSAHQTTDQTPKNAAGLREALGRSDRGVARSHSQHCTLQQDKAIFRVGQVTGRCRRPAEIAPPPQMPCICSPSLSKLPRKSLKKIRDLRRLIMLFTCRCGNARSGVQPDPNLLSSFWRDKARKGLSPLRALTPITPFGPYRFFKGIERSSRGSA